MEAGDGPYLVSHVENLPDTTWREYYILTYYLKGRRKVDPKTLFKKLISQKGEDVAKDWLSSGRGEQETRVYNLFPDSIEHYFELEFKGNESRLDELRTIDGLLEKDFVIEKSNQLPHNVACAVAPMQERVMNETACLIQLAFSSGSAYWWRDIRHLKFTLANLHHAAKKGTTKSEALKTADQAVKGLKSLDLRSLTQANAAIFTEEMHPLPLDPVRGENFTLVCVDLECDVIDYIYDREGENPKYGIGVTTAVDLLSALIEYTIYYVPKDRDIAQLVNYLTDLYLRLTESSFTDILVEKNHCFLDDVINQTTAPPEKGNDTDANLIYRLDPSITILSLNTYLYDEKKHTIAQMILANAEERDDEGDFQRELTLLDRVLVSKEASRIEEHRVHHNEKDWRKIMYDELIEYAYLFLNGNNLVINISQDTGQQTTQSFIQYVANLQGLQEGADYIFELDEGIYSFRLTKEGLKKIGAKQLPNGSWYTHHVRKPPVRKEIVENFGKGGWQGEAYFDSWFLNDAYDYLMHIKKEQNLKTYHPCRIIDFIKSSPSLREDFERRAFHWTQGDGYVTGLEIDVEKEFERIHGFDKLKDEEE
ncbi:MAG: hypothetical protein KJ574_02130 [Nanoarchaeota archaeon]|nr:hypothetical protein [Nanoarchaeota archaeon]